MRINGKFGKEILLVFSMMFCTVILFAGGQSEASSEEASSETEVKEIRLYHDNSEWQPFWDKVGALSEEEIGIRLKAISFQNTEQLRMRVRTDLRSESQAPEIFKWWFGQRAARLVDADLVEDISDVWDEVETNIKPGLKGLLTRNGLVYGIPYDSTNVCIWWYNKPVFEKYGLEPAETWDEFMDQLAFFKENGVYPIGNALGSRWNAEIMPQELIIRIDPDYYKQLQEGNASWTGEPVVKAFEIWRDMLKKEYFVPLDAGTSEYAEMFVNQKVAYIPIGSWFSAKLKGAGASPDNIGVTMAPAITPKGEKTMAVTLTPNMIPKILPKEKKEVVKKWLIWWASSEKAAQLRSEELGVYPFTMILDEETIEELNPVANKVSKFDVAYTNKVTRFYEAFPSDFVEYAIDEFAKMMKEPDYYMTLLENLDKKAEEIW